MQTNPFSYRLLILCTFLLPSISTLYSQKKVTVDWDKILTVSKTTPTLQVVVNPMLRRNSPIHRGAFEALKDLGANYVRFVPWFPYPHMAVAELECPSGNKTFWDFSYIDPIVEDFVKATDGHPVVMNFSTIPAWMFVTQQEAGYASDPDPVNWTYNQGTEFTDTTFKQLTDYYSRLLSWYTKGGFTDELGVYHKSGHFYKFPYWEILNEPDLEHQITVQQYTRIYDALVIALKKISPGTKFIGLSLAYENDPEWFEYFLDSSHHTGGVLPEAISYHFYGSPNFKGQKIDEYQYSFYDQANAFLTKVRYIENIRKRLAPGCITTINEIGNIIGDQQGTSIPDNYWNLSGGMFAYIYVELTKIGIDVAGESQLVGYPTQYPDVSMINWKNGQPNARFEVLKLLKENFGPGDKIITSQPNSGEMLTQGFISGKNKKLLLINKRNKEIELELPSDAKGAKMYCVNIATANEIVESTLTTNKITLLPYAVTVIQFTD
jgi:hypothetical protein